MYIYIYICIYIYIYNLITISSAYKIADYIFEC